MLQVRVLDRPARLLGAADTFAELTEERRPGRRTRAGAALYVMEHGLRN